MNGTIKQGLLVPTGGPFNDPNLHIGLAREAENSGWDGYFLWDQIIGTSCDSWILLGLIANYTKKIKIGTLVTGVPRRRPWKLARETVTVDHISNGRLILGVGLGDPDQAFSIFGENEDKKVRAKKLDEGLEIITKLWSGEEFEFNGEQFSISNVKFLPKPVQDPRIPIWVAGNWPIKAAFRRGSKYDGVVCYAGDRSLNYKEVQEVKQFVKTHGSKDNFEIVIIGSTPEDKVEGKQKTLGYQENGATWWIESIFEWQSVQDRNMDRVQDRIKNGPFSID